MLSAIVIPADMDSPLRLEELTEHDLNAYQRLVGGNIEVVRLERPSSSLYFNEEGKLLDMQPNRRATVLLWVHRSAFRGQDVIVGDAFVLGPPDDEGNDTSAPEELVDLLMETSRYRVLVQNEGEEEFYGTLRTFGSWFEAYRYGLGLVQRWSQIEDVMVAGEDGGEPDQPDEDAGM